MTADSFLTSSRYTSEQFHGIMLDTGAARTSTAGYGQAEAYTREFDTKLDTTTAGSINAHFGIGTATSIDDRPTVDSPVGRIECNN